MSTKDIHENHEPAPPLGLGSSEGLGADLACAAAAQYLAAAHPYVLQEHGAPVVSLGKRGVVRIDPPGWPRTYREQAKAFLAGWAAARSPNADVTGG